MDKKSTLVNELLERLENHPLPAAVDLKLDRIRGFLAKIGNPQDNIKNIIHVAGTNGKGSTIAYMQAILQELGYSVNVYTSPHLVRFNERIMLGGKQIDDDNLSEILQRILLISEDCPLTFFESATVAAFLAFDENPADFTLLEVGLGGRLDATNVITNPILTVITPVSHDHMDYLGDNLSDIATEKAGIIKQGVDCVIAKQESDALQAILDVAKERAAEIHCSLDGEQLKPSLVGKHQRDNAMVAITAIELLAKQGKISIPNEKSIVDGVAKAVWYARLQKLQQGELIDSIASQKLAFDVGIWLDGGHNAAAGQAIANWLQDRYSADKQDLHLIVGMNKDKDVAAFLRPISEYAESISFITTPNQPMASPSTELLAKIENESFTDKCKYEDDLQTAMDNILMTQNTTCDILICGSLYLAGFVLENNS